MIIQQREMVLPPIEAERNLLTHLARAVRKRSNGGAVPLRFAVTASGREGFRCEVAQLEGIAAVRPRVPESIFTLKTRSCESVESFNVVLLVPTGIGAELGGHAGDATPVAHLISAVCDTLITHPNVVNASDINEMPANALYVEGSVICRLLMGTAALRPVRSNRVLVVLDAHEDESFVNLAINSVSAARATYGLSCPRVVVLDPPLKLAAQYTSAGTAAGSVDRKSVV